MAKNLSVRVQRSITVGGRKLNPGVHDVSVEEFRHIMKNGAGVPTGDGGRLLYQTTKNKLPKRG